MKTKKGRHVHVSLRPAQALTHLGLPLAVLCETDLGDANETGRVNRTKVHQAVHAALLGAVQLLRLAEAAQDADRALVGAQPDRAVHRLLAGDHALLDELPLRGEVQPVVNQLGPVERDELVAQRAHLTVQHQTLQVDVGGPQDGHGGRVVASSALDADVTVLDNVDTANAVLSANGVQSRENIKRVSQRLARGKRQLDRQALLERDSKVLGGVGCVKGRVGHPPHVIRRSLIGVLL